MFPRKMFDDKGELIQLTDEHETVVTNSSSILLRLDRLYVDLYRSKVQRPAFYVNKKKNQTAWNPIN